MRNLLYFIFCCALFSCKKQSDPECKLTSIQSGTIFPTTTTYEYDQQGRIIKMIGPPGTTIVTYYSDSIVLTDPSTITTYYIGSSGLATTSKSRSSFPDQSQPTSEYNYTYNTEGYLVQMGGVYSRIVNGITTRDTFNWSFTIQNGNITEYRSGNVIVGSYQYTNLIAKENIAFTNQPVYQWPFLGKFSRNLMSNMPTFTGSVRFEYEFDAESNILKKKEFHTGSAGHTISYYNYQCD